MPLEGTWLPLFAETLLLGIGTVIPNSDWQEITSLSEAEGVYQLPPGVEEPE
jgi:hypothetical protein